MRKFILLFISILALLSGCQKGPSAKQVAKVMEKSLGKDIKALNGTLVNDLGFMPGVRLDYKIRYDMGDTTITVIPDMADQSKVGGVFMSINISDPERALKTYKELRELIKESHPYYGAKIINNQPPYDVYSSTDPQTIDTISPAYMRDAKITFNERWHEQEDYNDRNSVAMIYEPRFSAWKVNLIYRSFSAMDF